MTTDKECSICLELCNQGHQSGYSNVFISGNCIVVEEVLQSESRQQVVDLIFCYSIPGGMAINQSEESHLRSIFDSSKLTFYRQSLNLMKRLFVILKSL